MSKYMKVLQIFYNEVEHFIFLYKLTLVFILHHSLHVVKQSSTVFVDLSWRSLG